jgi:putative FmdB family regulatory protein
MPIYEYECRGCGELFELLILKGTVAACPTCQSQDLEQLLSGFAVSSQDITRANVAAARKKYAASSLVRDQKVHEAEEIIEHTPSLAEKKVKPNIKKL